MKIAFITLSCARNYGAVLQTYALYRFLTGLGHDVELVDYVTESYHIDAPDYVYRSTRRWSRNALTVFLWRHSRKLCEIRARDTFRAFLLNRVRMSPRYLSNDELRANLPDADVFLTGSDQIWNTDFSWSRKIDLPYFLDFVPDGVAKIAYASSFGKSKLEEREKPDILSRLKRFDALGVREDEGRKIITDLGLDATVVADPTLLIGRETWASLAAPRPVRKPYLLVFQIVPDRELMKTADRIARCRGLKTVVVSPNPADVKKLRRRAVYLPSVETWLSYFLHADFLITDSFHATAFSVIFQKQFLTSTRARYDGRILGFLTRMGLEGRATNDWGYDRVAPIPERDIDYGPVGLKLDAFVSDSSAWLRSRLDAPGNQADAEARRRGRSVPHARNL